MLSLTHPCDESHVLFKALRRLVLSHELGGSAGSKVFMAKDRHGNGVFALKMFRPYMDRNGKTLGSKDVDVLQDLQHVKFPSHLIPEVC